MFKSDNKISNKGFNNTFYWRFLNEFIKLKISIKYIVNMLIAIHNVLNKKVGMRVSSVNVRPSQLELVAEKSV